MIVLATSFGDIGLEVLGFLIPVLATTLTIVISYLLKKLVDKLGVEHSEKIDNMIDKYVKIGVDYANQAATKKLGGKEYSSEDKLNIAVKTVLAELEQSGIRDVAAQLIVGRIESSLFGEKVEGGFIPPA